MSSNIAQPLLQGVVSTNTLPSTKSSPNNFIFVGNSCYYSKNQQLKLQRPSFINGVKAMKSDGSDQLRRPGLKRREPSAASIGLWDRFPAARTVQQMLDTMDRIIEDPIAYNNTWPSSSSFPNNGGEYVRGRTPWEIKELEGEYKMRFDMPGMTKDDVNLWVEEKMLVIKAEKVSKTNGGHENGALENEGEWSAKSYGRYNTRIALPENVEFEKIKAEVKDGVLYITIPKATSSNKVFNINVQ